MLINGEIAALKEAVKKLQEDSHPPVDIAPRIYDELERMLLLGRMFYDIPSTDLHEAATVGLNYFTSNVNYERR